MLSPTPNFMHLYNFATYFIFLLEIKKCFVLQQGQSFSLPLKSSIFASWNLLPYNRNTDEP